MTKDMLPTFKRHILMGIEGEKVTFFWGLVCWKVTHTPVDGHTLVCL